MNLPKPRAKYTVASPFQNNLLARAPLSDFLHLIIIVALCTILFGGARLRVAGARVATALEGADVLCRDFKFVNVHHVILVGDAVV